MPVGLKVVHGQWILLWVESSIEGFTCHKVADLSHTDQRWLARLWPSLFVIVQSLNCILLFVTPWTAACQAPLFFTVSWSLLKFMSAESVVLSNHFTLCCPLLLSLFPSIRVFFNDSALCIRRPKYWSFSSSPSNEYSQLIFFRIDWFDSLTVQGTLKSLQHHSLKASVL